MLFFILILCLSYKNCPLRCIILFSGECPTFADLISGLFIFTLSMTTDTEITLSLCVCLYLGIKENVEGDNCDRCRPDTFGLSVQNPLGCSKCYCYGLTHSCTEAQGLIRMWVSRQTSVVLIL